MTASLACVYVINLEPRYLRMAHTSLASLRRFDPRLMVIVKVADQVDRIYANSNDDLRHLIALADQVDHIPPAASNYFPANKTVLREIDADRIAFVDADTVFFGSLAALDRRFARFDIAACPSPWVWRHGYQRRFAPDVYLPLNSGLVVMTRRFAQTWGTVNATRPSELLADIRRAPLVGWLRSVNHDAWPRGDLTLSELAWNGHWAVGLMGPRDCCLLTRWPKEEDPLVWRAATVFHPYSHLWSSCLARLRATGWVDPTA